MKRMIFVVILFVMLPCLSQASLQMGADKLINQISPKLNIGIQVVDLTTGILLYQRNPRRFFVPASNMKLFSDAAAILALGPDYRFKNQLSTTASRLQQGVLTGALYLSFSGDPSFDHGRLTALLTHLETWSVKRIKGNIYLDSSHAHINPYPPGWMAEDYTHSYGAPLAPIILDGNRLTVTVNPAGKIDALAVIEMNDASKSIMLTNHVKTKVAGSHCGVSFSLDEVNHLTVAGCVAQGQWAMEKHMAIRNPLAYTQGVIKQQLFKSNIILEGAILLGKVPPGAFVIANEYSKPISQLLADTLKPSDNLYADSLFLHVAQKLRGNAVNWQEAKGIIKQFIEQQTGIKLNKAILTDGSGLSRHDFITPRQTTSLLRFLYDKFPLSYEYISALPVSGRDGTLQRRFKRPGERDLVRAKTGTMRGIVSLSGYLYTANSHTLAFAIFINHIRGTKPAIAGKYRYLVNALCTYFLKQKPSNSISHAPYVPMKPKPLRFQQNPTQAELQMKQQARWRRLEIKLKEALKGQFVTVIYRNQELILQDNQPSFVSVFAVLQKLAAHYPFAVALASKSSNPTFKKVKPFVLWMDDPISPSDSRRTWIIREATG